MCFTCGGPLNTSSVSSPAKPFSLVAKGTLCQALKVSRSLQDCQAVVKGQDEPEAFSASSTSPNSPQAFGGAFGSRPACSKASRSEEHTSELQSLMRISYAVFCLKKNTNHINENA